MYISLILASIDFRDPIWQFWIGVGSLVLSALAIVVTIVMTVRSRQKKALTYEVVSNTSVVNVDNDVGEDLKLVLEGQVVTKVRLHVIKLLNAGNTVISPEDYPNQLSFQFDSPPYSEPLIRCGIHRTEPPNLLPEHQAKNLLAIDTPSQTTMTLKPPLLNPREAIFLKVLLLADHRESTSMRVIGQIKEGTIQRSASAQPRVTRRIVVIGVLVAFVLGLLISNSVGVISAFTGGTCAFGSIQVSGSTSFYNTALKQAQKYKEICPIASIAVGQSSSRNGLSDLEHGLIHIADSELTAPASANLQDHEVAVIVFALILNKKVTNISNLSIRQIRAIYSGNAKYWDEVDKNAPHRLIRVIGRSTDSGTHAAFVNYVLGSDASSFPSPPIIDDRSAQVVSDVANTDGAIGYTDLGDVDNSVTTLDIEQNAPSAPLIEKNIYQFWAIERMYTSQNPDALTTSFINYVKQGLQTSDTFISLGAMDPMVLASHNR